jgi:hypothetical protein
VIAHRRLPEFNSGMAELHYCWRCATTVPMLDENEWLELAPLMYRTLANSGRREPERAEARTTEPDGSYAAARAKYRELTGFDEPQVAAIWHHQLRLFGPPCANCGRLLRTANARYCSGCGAFAKRRAVAPPSPSARHAAPPSGEQG